MRKLEPLQTTPRIAQAEGNITSCDFLNNTAINGQGGGAYLDIAIASITNCRLAAERLPLRERWTDRLTAALGTEAARMWAAEQIRSAALVSPRDVALCPPPPHACTVTN
jgi:hypothetical protein